MVLPVIENTHFVDVKCPSGKTIGVKAWKFKDEKDLLLSIEGQDNSIDKINNIIKSIKNCSNDQKLFDTLSESDIKKLAIEVRKLSNGDEIEYNYKCPECNSKFTDVVNLDVAQVVKFFNPAPIQINDDLIVSFKDVDHKTVQKIYKDCGDSQIKFAFEYLSNSIAGLTYKNTTYTEFTAKDVMEFLDQLDVKTMEKIQNEFSNVASSLELKRVVKCFKCGTDVTINFGDMLSFLVL